MRQRRQRLKHLNKYQKKIIFLSIGPIFCICVFVTILLVVFVNQLKQVIANYTPEQTMIFIKQSLLAIDLILWASLILFALYASRISVDLVGAFSRIVNECDQVINQQKKKWIRVREKDELAKELTKRINILIEGFHKRI